MTDFFAELKRRNIYRVGAAYAVVAWVLLQLVANVAPIFELPAWIARAVVLLLAIGFPVALIFAWVHEIAPGTVTRGAGWSDPQPAGPARVDWILTGALVIVIAIFVYQQFAPSRSVANQQASVEAARAAASTQAGVSIAVLPFANMSGDAGQEFFSDGMTEEITSALAKVPDLRVVGRTSAFQFKGQNQDLRSIGQSLAATHLIEGSVRKVGDRVRITVQLIKADDGTHIWAEDYDRQLTDIFAVQEDIARAITASLRMPLGLKPGENLVNNRTNDLDSYQQYLRARALYRARAIDDAIAVLEPAVARDPGYAPAQALLAQCYARAPVYNPTMRTGGVLQSLLNKAERAARETIRLDPKHSGGYAGLAVVEEYRGGRWPEAEDFYRQALKLDPNDADTLQAYSMMLADAGRLKDSLALRAQLRTLEPFVPIYNAVTARIMAADGDRQTAIRMLEAIPPDAGDVSSIGRTFLASAYAAVGRYGEARNVLLAIAPDFPLSSRQSIEDAAQLLRTAPARASARTALPALEGPMAYFYLYSNAPERALEYPEDSARTTYLVAISFTPFWASEYAPVRKTERFKAVVRAWGFPAYWRQRGWPDLCHPMGADDFACE